MFLDYSQFIPEVNKDLIEDHQSPLYNKIVTNFFDSHYEECKYCKTKLSTPLKNIPVEGTFGNDKIKIVYDCSNCGWWIFKFEESLYLGEGVSLSESRRLLGILKKYPYDSKEVPLNTLRDELIKRPSIAYQLNPTKFEKLVGDILKDHLNCEVTHVGKSNDGGIDLILINSNNETTIVQVKRRTKQNSTEGVAPIRELIGAMTIENEKKAIFVTTAKKYSRDAEEAKLKVINNNKVESIELIDFPRFIDILKLNKHKNHRPWEKFIDTFK